jgi:hypothetical protein
MPSNYVQGAEQTTTWTALATLAAGAYSVGPTIDTGSAVPYEVLLKFSAGVASTPAPITNGVNFYLQYSLDGTNWTSFTPADDTGITDMEFIGQVPVQSAAVTTKLFSTAGNPTCRWIRPVAKNATNVALNSGSLTWAAITGS